MSVVVQSELAVVSALPEPRVRLDFLDGIRGLAAIYVAFFHVAGALAKLSPADAAKTPALALFAARGLSFGHQAVGVFMVLSGYCLMLPVVRSAGGQLPGGFWAYFQRRAWRILPPYYAALILTLLQILITARLKHLGTMPPEFGAGQLLSHLFLIHNLKPVWAQTIDPPLWSVATEWQIYFIFPALLLPLWRRFGIGMAALTGIVVGIAPHFLLPKEYSLDTGACPWMLGLFAMGMAGAVLGFTGKETLRQYQARLPWGRMAIGFLAAFAGITAFYPTAPDWAMDNLIGLATACLIVSLARSAQADATTPRPAILRLLSARIPVRLGAFSYSLYLIHLPAWWTLQPVMKKLHLSPTGDFLFQVLIGMPYVLMLAYGFHLLFERRFVSSRSQAERSERARAAGS